MLDVAMLTAGYGQIPILQSISLSVGEREIVALIGSNGSGKSTTLGAISNMIRIFSGTVTFMDRRLDQTPSHDIIVLGITYVPEGRHLFSDLTVLENLQLGAYRFKNPHRRDTDLQRVFHLFPRLEQRKNQLAGTLSGGEQQMAALGRGLMSEPKLLLLDEPSQGLAPVIVDELFKTIKEVNRQGTAILLVEQNARRTLKISHRGYVLDNGSIAVSGKAEELVSDDRVKKTYLGLS